jgi:hypothetical protein
VVAIVIGGNGGTGRKDGEELQARRRQDEEAWRRAVAAHTVAAYEDYLASFPNGGHIPVARQAVKTLAEEETLRAADDQAWQAAKTTNSISGYEIYLAEHPTGAYLAAARRALRRLREETARVSSSEEVREQMVQAVRPGIPAGGAPVALSPEVMPRRPPPPPDTVIALSSSSSASSPETPVVKIMKGRGELEQKPCWEFEWPSAQSMAVLVFLGLICLVLSNILLKGALGGFRLGGILFSLFLSYGGMLWYLVNSQEVDFRSALLASLACLGGALGVLILLVAMAT